MFDPASFLTLAELAITVKISNDSLRRAVARGEIPTHRIGRRMFFILEEVLEATRRAAPPVQSIHSRRVTHKPTPQPDRGEAHGDGHPPTAL